MGSERLANGLLLFWPGSEMLVPGPSYIDLMGKEPVPMWRYLSGFPTDSIDFASMHVFRGTSSPLRHSVTFKIISCLIYLYAQTAQLKRTIWNRGLRSSTVPNLFKTLIKGSLISFPFFLSPFFLLLSFTVEFTPLFSIMC